MPPGMRQTRARSRLMGTPALMAPVEFVRDKPVNPTLPPDLPCLSWAVAQETNGFGSEEGGGVDGNGDMGVQAPQLSPLRETVLCPTVECDSPVALVSNYVTPSSSSTVAQPACSTPPQDSASPSPSPSPSPTPAVAAPTTSASTSHQIQQQDTAKSPCTPFRKLSDNWARVYISEGTNWRGRREREDAPPPESPVIRVSNNEVPDSAIESQTEPFEDFFEETDEAVEIDEGFAEQYQSEADTNDSENEDSLDYGDSSEGGCSDDERTRGLDFYSETEDEGRGIRTSSGVDSDSDDDEWGQNSCETFRNRSISAYTQAQSQSCPENQDEDNNIESRVHQLVEWSKEIAPESLPTQRVEDEFDIQDLNDTTACQGQKRLRDVDDDCDDANAKRSCVCDGKDSLPDATQIEVNLIEDMLSKSPIPEGASETPVQSLPVKVDHLDVIEHSVSSGSKPRGQFDREPGPMRELAINENDYEDYSKENSEASFHGLKPSQSQENKSTGSPVVSLPRYSQGDLKSPPSSGAMLKMFGYDPVDANHISSQYDPASPIIEYDPAMSIGTGQPSYDPKVPSSGIPRTYAPWRDQEEDEIDYSDYEYLRRSQDLTCA